LGGPKAKQQTRGSVGEKKGLEKKNTRGSLFQGGEKRKRGSPGPLITSEGERENKTGIARGTANRPGGNPKLNIKNQFQKCKKLKHWKKGASGKGDSLVGGEE